MFILSNEKDIFIIINFFTFTYLHSSEIKLGKIFDGLNKPWSLSFVDENNILVTEKNWKSFVCKFKR